MQIEKNIWQAKNNMEKINPEDYEVVSSHFYRKCHPETCGCDSEFLVINRGDRTIAGKVDSEEDGSKLIEIMGFTGKEKVTRTYLINQVYESVKIAKNIRAMVEEADRNS